MDSIQIILLSVSITNNLNYMNSNRHKSFKFSNGSTQRKLYPTGGDCHESSRGTFPRLPSYVDLQSLRAQNNWNRRVT